MFMSGKCLPIDYTAWISIGYDPPRQNKLIITTDIFLSNFLSVSVSPVITFQDTVGFLSQGECRTPFGVTQHNDGSLIRSWV